MIRLALILPTIIIIYVFWIRPILKTTPTFKQFYDAEENYAGALSSKFGGIKQKLTGALIFAASVIVELWDYVAPALGSVDTTPLTSYVPPWAWPLISIGAVMLLNYFRKLSDQRSASDADAVQAAITTQPMTGTATPKAG